MAHRPDGGQPPVKAKPGGVAMANAIVWGLAISALLALIAALHVWRLVQIVKPDRDA